MSQLFSFLQQHSFWSAVGAYWIFSAAVSSLPAPLPNGSRGYLWFFNFLHGIAGNVTTVFGSKIPGIATKAVPAVLLCALLFSIQACAPYLVHPGSVNTFDSKTYDALLTAEGAINEAHSQFTAGTLPASTKPLLDALEKSYNAARDAWLLWHNAAKNSTNTPTMLATLNMDMTNLSNALAAFKGAK